MLRALIMHSRIVRHSLVVVLALAAIATAGYRLSRPATRNPDASPRPVSARDTQSPARSVARASVGRAGAPEPATPAVSAPVVAPRFVTASLAAAFPGLTAPSGGWRSLDPESLTVAPHPDLPIRFTRASVKHEGPYTTWIGRNPALPGASLVTVATADGYDAILVLPSASQFSFHVRGADVVITETVPGEEGCGVAPAQADRPSSDAAGFNLADVINERPTLVSGVEGTVRSGFLPDSATVDVLFAYDADTLAAATKVSSDPVGYIDRQCKAMIETSNIFLSQSNVTTFTWRHLGVVAAPAYPRDDTTALDLDALTNATMLRDWVLDTRYRRGADQFMLLVGGKTDFGGRAYSNTQAPISRAFAVGMMRWSLSAKTLAHELAHNFGCKHDRAHVVVNGLDDYGPPAPDSNGVWAYGQMWDNGKLPPGYIGTSGTGGTIMSYADWIVPYFSNPNLTIRVTGSTFGWSSNPDLGTHQLGRAETDPKAAYNARVLAENGPTMAAIEEEIQAPTISTQPRSATVVRGNTYLLTVIASGGGLSYQWRRGTSDIAGATSSSYSRIVEADESQPYSVVVSNLAGSVTSEAATITVSAPPPPPGSSSGGGGGGGGAPSLGFFVGIVLLAAIRRLTRPRS